MWGVNNTVEEGGIKIAASGGGEVTYSDGDGFTLAEDGNYTISGTWNGRITGATKEERKSVILVAKDMNVDITLSGVTIDVSGTAYVAAFQIADDSTGDVGITLEGNNTLKSGGPCAGLQKNGAGENIGELTIDGVGKLTAAGGNNGAGIGGGVNGTGIIKPLKQQSLLAYVIVINKPKIPD